MARKKSLLRSSPLRKRKRRAFVLKTLLVLAVLAVVVTCLSYLSKLDSLQIKTVSVQGNQALELSDIEKKVEPLLEGNYLYLFSKRNAFLYPRGAIKKVLLEAFPRLVTVNTEPTRLTALAVSIVEREPFGLWCKSSGSADDPVLSDQCYFFDKSGFIFAASPQFSGGVYLKYYGKISGTEPLRSTYEPTDPIDSLRDFAQGVQALRLTPVKLAELPRGEYELLLSNGGRIYFSNRQSFAATIDNLKVLMREEKIDASTNYAFDYIDLRFGNKVYYKPKSR